MRLENEAQVEQEIRKIALNYCQRTEPAAPYPYGGGQHVTFNWPGNLPASMGDMPPLVTFRTTDLRIDVCPMIDGFERLLIAEEQLREQIAQIAP